MVKEYARLARPYFVLLAIVTLGRWLIGTAFHVPYDKGTWYMSIVMLTMFASIFSTAFARRWLGYRLMPAAGFAMFMALVSQLVILLSTLISYGLDIPSYFRDPMALARQTEAMGFGAAMVARVGGLVVNTIVNGILGAVGWALGGLLPVRER